MCCRDGMYDLDFKNPNSDKSQWLTPDKLLALYCTFLENYPMVSIEDPFDQDDWEAWAKITSCVKAQVRLAISSNWFRCTTLKYINC